MMRTYLSTFFAVLMGVTSLYASSEEAVLGGDVPGQRLHRITQSVGGECLLLRLEARQVTTYALGCEDATPLDYAKECYGQLGGKLYATGYAPEVTITADNVNTSLLVALTHGIMWTTSTPITGRTSIFHAQKDVSVCAPILNFEGLFCTSTTGRIILKAPEGSKGFLRSITFERVEGERPFDMFFSSGRVSFEGSSIQDLIVTGANTVILEVDPSA